MEGVAVIFDVVWSGAGGGFVERFVAGVVHIGVGGAAF